MATRAIKDAKDLSTNELIYFKGHAKATYMSDGRNVEEVITGTGEGSVVGIARKEVAKVIDSAPETMDTLKKIADLIEKDAEQAADILATLGDHEARIGTLENKFVVLSETEYEDLDKKEDKFYFCYEE